MLRFASGSVNALILAALWSGPGRGLFIICVAAFGFPVVVRLAASVTLLLLIRIDLDAARLDATGRVPDLAAGQQRGPLAASLGVVGRGRSSAP
ncbi:hypothetical protein ACRAWD_26995 [Caulobacter segnis]